MTIRIRGLPASFGISKRGDPVVHGREPVPHSGAVRLSTHHPLGTGCRQAQARRQPQRRGTRAQHHPLSQVVLRRAGSQPVRLLGGTDKELCEGEVLLRVERDSEPRGDPQVRRQVIEEEEVTG